MPMTLSSKSKKLLWLLFRFVLSASLLAYLYTKIDVARTVAVVRAAHVAYIGAAFVIFLGLNAVLLTRWTVLIRALDLRVRFISVFRYFFIGLFGNLFLPTSIGGDVIKILGLCRETTQKPRVVASVLLDRLSGFAGLILVAFLAFAAAFRLLDDWRLFIFVLALGALIAVMALVLFNERIYTFCCGIFSPFPRLKKAVMDIHYDAALLKDRRSALYKAVGLSALSQALLAVDFWLVACALHQHVLLVYFLVFVPLICVVSSLPSIGGLGVREWGSAVLLGKVGVSSGVAVSISLMSFLFMVIVGLAGGLIYLGTDSPSLLKGKDALDEEDAPAQPFPEGKDR